MATNKAKRRQFLIRHRCRPKLKSELKLDTSEFVRTVSKFLKDSKSPEPLPPLLRCPSCFAEMPSTFVKKLYDFFEHYNDLAKELGASDFKFEICEITEAPDLDLKEP
jgi:hypothetical protein